MRRAESSALTNNLVEETTNVEEGPWPRGVSRKAQFSIGNVVERLKKEFPSLSISKVRFLEEQGIVSPARTASGYRKFSTADIERLRYCLASQRDCFKPIQTIREELEALDNGEEVQVQPVARIVSDEGIAVEPVTGSYIRRRDLLDFTGVTETFLDELIEVGLVVADARGRFPASSVNLVRLVRQLQSAQIAPRNLRSLVNQASKLATLSLASEGQRKQGIEGERQRAKAHDIAKIASRALEIMICDEVERRG
ncbi:hypothetical protein BSR28_04225 [Boudabousia liubingyangii]|uniref:transcriptional regulator FtsR n=1 Tax=Boudabousia liubingyangii TaxID=1921764 RepID=UPI000939BBD5|nr:MerR family transcriptional regulator [Boudabousia liubingyangii]OKL47702.1 hypothetical protein BSR28_04225 [Boudabousia liubingyangii]